MHARQPINQDIILTSNQPAVVNAIPEVVTLALNWFRANLDRASHTVCTPAEFELFNITAYLQSTLLKHPMSIADYWMFVTKVHVLLPDWTKHTEGATDILVQVPFWAPLQQLLTDWDNTGATLMRAYEQCPLEISGAIISIATDAYAHQLNWDTESFTWWADFPTRLNQFTQDVIDRLPPAAMPVLADALLRINKSQLLPPITTFDSIFTTQTASIVDRRQHLSQYLSTLLSFGGWDAEYPVDKYLLDNYWATLDWSVSAFHETGSDLNILLSDDDTGDAFAYLIPRLTSALTPVIQAEPATFAKWLRDATRCITLSEPFVQMLAELPVVENAVAKKALDHAPHTIATWLRNDAYSLDQRLDWLEQHGSALSTWERLPDLIDTLPSPLREVAFLYAAMQCENAPSGRANWKKAIGTGLSSERTRTRFFATHAPVLASMYPAIRSLDLSCKDALVYCLNYLSSEKTTVALPLLDLASL